MLVAVLIQMEIFLPVELSEDITKVSGRNYLSDNIRLTPPGIAFCYAHCIH